MIYSSTSNQFFPYSSSCISFLLYQLSYIYSTIPTIISPLLTFSFFISSTFFFFVPFFYFPFSIIFFIFFPFSFFLSFPSSSPSPSLALPPSLCIFLSCHTLPSLVCMADEAVAMSHACARMPWVWRDSVSLSQFLPSPPLWARRYRARGGGKH